MICSIASPPDMPGSSRSIVTRSGAGLICDSRAMAASAVAHTSTTSIAGSHRSRRASAVA